VNWDNVRREDWIVGGLALLLALDLLILSWFSFPSLSITIGSTTIGASGSLTATDAPDGWLGILAVIAALLVILVLALERLSPETEVPAIEGSRTTTRFVLAGAAAVFMALKFLFHLGHFSNLGIGFWLGAGLVGALLYFTAQARNAEGVASSRPAEPPAQAGRAGSAGPPSA